MENPIPSPSDRTPPEAAAGRGGLFSRLRRGLGKTGSRLREGLAALAGGHGRIDGELLEEIETRLLSADVGLEATEEVIEGLRRKLDRRQLADGDAFVAALKEELTAILLPCEQPLAVTARGRPFVILMVGVNGAGKTTSIGKLARRLRGEGHSVMLAAGDTFRAAAVEQLRVWGELNGMPVVAQAAGADSAAVIFDAWQSARAKGIDVLIADTAGRLHTRDNLMRELEKIVRVLRKQDAAIPDEILLVLDATTGQERLGLFFGCFAPWRSRNEGSRRRPERSARQGARRDTSAPGSGAVVQRRWGCGTPSARPKVSTAAQGLAALC